DCESACRPTAIWLLPAPPRQALLRPCGPPGVDLPDLSSVRCRPWLHRGGRGRWRGVLPLSPSRTHTASDRCVSTPALLSRVCLPRNRPRSPVRSRGATLEPARSGSDNLSTSIRFLPPAQGLGSLPPARK